MTNIIDKIIVTAAVGGMLCSGIKQMIKVDAELCTTSGYVLPSQCKIYLKDEDADGRNETIMKVRGKDYLLRYDSTGTPEIIQYKVMPKKIQEKQK